MAVPTNLAYIYLIIDFAEPIELSDAVSFIDRVADFQGISGHLTCEKTTKWNGARNKHGLLAKAKKHNDTFWAGFHVEDSDSMTVLDEASLDTYTALQQVLFSQMQQSVPAIEEMRVQNWPLTRILEEGYLDQFMLFAKNISLLDVLNPYGRWLNKLVQTIPLEEYRQCVSAIQLHQTTHDSGIDVNESYPGYLFRLAIHFDRNKLELMILPLFGRSSLETLEMLAGYVSDLLKGYPLSCAYLDTNKFSSEIETPHEHFFNYKEVLDRITFDQRVLRIRGYTRYCWINARQQLALGEYDSLTSTGLFSVFKQPDHVLIRLDQPTDVGYAHLKRYFSPLLIRWQNQAVDSTIFSHPLMLHTIVDNDEWQVAEKAFEEVSMEGQPLISRLQMRRLQKMIKDMGLAVPPPDVTRSVNRDNTRKGLTHNQ